MSISNGLPGLLASVAASVPGRPAVVAAGRATSYGELLARARSLAADLVRRGFRPGDRVALLLPNGLEFVLAYFAATTAGAIVVPLYEKYGHDELRYFLDECGVSVLVAAREAAGLAAAVIPLCRRPCELLIGEDWTAQDRESSVAVLPEVDPSSPAMHQFSSGSTGRPKRISRSHEQLLLELDSLQQALGTGPEDRFLGVAPFSHVNGLTRSMLSSVRAGAALHPLPTFDRHAVAEMIEREHLSIFIAVPFMFATLAQSRFDREPDFSSLRLCISASAPMPETLNRLYRDRFGMPVRQLYGSTETGTISVNLCADIDQTLASVGLPLRGVEVELFRDDGSPAAAGEVGEIAIRSRSAIGAYDELPEANREAFRDGYFWIGDLGRRDADGSLTLVGRKTFFINKGGFKIDPREIEEVLESHPSVREVVVVGVPSRYGDERVKAVVVARVPCTELELVEHCRGRIANFKVPSLVEFRDSLPTTPTGKIRRALLR